MMLKTTSCVAGLVLLAGITGCKVHVDKGANGEDQKVQVDMPFGSIHVNADQITAADLGLPAYPGAQAVKSDDKHKSADVHLGFGEWEMRVRVVSFATPDSKDQVTAFYKKALVRYGDVIVCQGNAPVGSPTVTSEGLSCSDSDKVKINPGDSSTAEFRLQLKAGSKRHQHIVGFEEPQDNKTRFALIALDLPANATKNGSGTSD
jgi:hypothetical protein